MGETRMSVREESDQEQGRGRGGLCDKHKYKMEQKDQRMDLIIFDAVQ